MEMIFVLLLLIACMAVVEFFPGTRVAQFLASIATDEDTFRDEKKGKRENVSKVNKFNKAA